MLSLFKRLKKPGSDTLREKTDMGYKKWGELLKREEPFRATEAASQLSKLLALHGYATTPTDLLALTRTHSLMKHAGGPYSNEVMIIGILLTEDDYREEQIKALKESYKALTKPTPKTPADESLAYYRKEREIGNTLQFFTHDFASEVAHLRPLTAAVKFLAAYICENKIGSELVEPYFRRQYRVNEEPKLETKIPALKIRPTQPDNELVGMDEIEPEMPIVPEAEPPESPPPFPRPAHPNKNATVAEENTPQLEAATAEAQPNATPTDPTAATDRIGPRREIILSEAQTEAIDYLQRHHRYWQYRQWEQLGLTAPVPFLYGAIGNGVTTSALQFGQVVDKPILHCSCASWCPKGASQGSTLDKLEPLLNKQWGTILVLDDIQMLKANNQTSAGWYESVMVEVLDILNRQNPRINWDKVFVVGCASFPKNHDGTEILFDGDEYWTDSETTNRQRIHPAIHALVKKHPFHVKNMEAQEWQQHIRHMGQQLKVNAATLNRVLREHNTPDLNKLTVVAEDLFSDVAAL